MTKYIFVTGGVVSSVGKGITVASIGNLLKSRGLTVSVIKLDPYLNVDPGTMSPYQHGEVFVTKDGAETDLDLGNYERFIDTELTADSNITSGQIYSSVIAKERRGDFLGGTIQVIPHVTTEIKERFKKLSKSSEAEVILVEVGGTVGDIEGQPFLEAIRQMRNDVGRDNVLYIHVTLLPYIGSTKELKTKPTQHSVNELRRMGIQPDVIVCRADYPISEGIRDKISLFCDVERKAVIPLVTVSSIYEVPLVLEAEGMGNLVVERLGLKAAPPELSGWQRMVSCHSDACNPVNIAVVGKYVELEDAYFSVRESLRHAGQFHNRPINLTWVHSEELEKNNDVEAQLRSVQGIVVPGGFGIRGIEGMIKTARYAREKNIPYLGLCLGMQIMVIEFARFVFKSDKPNSTEFDPETPYPVIDLLPEQRSVAGKGGTMRLGNYRCLLVPGTKADQAYSDPAYIEKAHSNKIFTDGGSANFVIDDESNSISRSLEGGKAWTKQPPSVPVKINSWLAVNSNTMLVGSAEGIIYTTNKNGMVWLRRQAFNDTSINVTDISVASNGDYLSAGLDSSGSIWLSRSTDGGICWKSIKTSLTGEKNVTLNPTPDYAATGGISVTSDISGNWIGKFGSPSGWIHGVVIQECRQHFSIEERHRHRFEFNNDYRQKLGDAGLVYSGLSPDGRLVEICELRDHPWMVGSQFHPEFCSRPDRPQPLFAGFIGVAKDILREGSQPALPLTP